MPVINYKNKSFNVTVDGFLSEFKDWCSEWVNYIKEEENIVELTDDHQKLIDFLQTYYSTNGSVPTTRSIIKNTGFKLKQIYDMFPSGPNKGAGRMAGLPKSSGCI